MKYLGKKKTGKHTNCDSEGCAGDNLATRPSSHKYEPLLINYYNFFASKCVRSFQPSPT